MPRAHFIRLFLPHSHNNHKPRVIHNHSLLFLAGLMIMLQSAVFIVGRLRPDVLGYSAFIAPEEIVRLTNQHRKAARLPELKINQQLTNAAQAKALDMFQKDYWSHNAPDGTQPWYFISGSGYVYLHAGENLARDFTNPESVVTAWMNSPTHKANLLSEKYLDIGVAVVDGKLNGLETTLVVQMFGATQQNKPDVTPQAGQISLVGKALAEELPEALKSPAPLRISPFDLSRSISISFVILIVGTLALDWLIVWRRNVIRVSGKTWAHLTYMGVILIIIFLARQGLVL